MTLTPGTKLGPYEILSPIGAGGMSEVWRARDTRLGRTVVTDSDCGREWYATNRKRKYYA